MRMLKCYPATDARRRYVTAGNALSTGNRVWSCISCGCGLILHAGSQQEAPRFEHDLQNVIHKVLMECAYLEPEVKASAKQRKMKTMLAELEPVSPVTFWHCILCGDDYDDEKYCMTCGTGIYSIERALP